MPLKVVAWGGTQHAARQLPLTILAKVSLQLVAKTDSLKLYFTKKLLTGRIDNVSLPRAAPSSYHSPFLKQLAGLSHSGGEWTSTHKIKRLYITYNKSL